MGNKTMTISDISKATKQFKDTHTIQVGGFGKTIKAPSWFVEFEKKNDQRWVEQEQFNQFVVEQFKKQEQFNQFVLEQFKKHGWVK